jgi:amidase
MHDPLGAFVPGDTTRVAGRPEGPLRGLTFAAKDLFDVVGTVTGCGNPDWAASHDTAERSAWAVEKLLDAGATLVGKTITDEISLGLVGINRHQGTPINPKASDLVPGGSSSGSASAVAGKLVDVALGTDSGGSVRIPASFCGLYGLRPTHGRLPVAGMMTQSPSFDTVGFFARDAETLGRVGTVLFDEPSSETLPAELLVASDCFALAEPEVRDALQPALAALKNLLPRVRDATLAQGDLVDWARHQRLLQSYEFGRTFAEWIDKANPRFSFEVASSLAHAALIRDEDMNEPRAFREQARQRLDTLLGDHRVICLPTSPILPIRCDARLSEIKAAVHRIVDLTCIAGLTGLPQINLPLGWHGPIPVGLSVIGWRGSDATLLDLARALSIGVDLDLLYSAS